MDQELVYAAKGLGEAVAAVRLLDMAPRDSLVGLGVMAVGEPDSSQWYVYANFRNPTRQYLAKAEAMLNAFGSKSDLNYATLASLSPNIVATGTGQQIIQALTAIADAQERGDI